MGSEPLVVAGSWEDPFTVVERQPTLAGAAQAAPAAIGGGWFGYIGYHAGALVDRQPPPRHRSAPMPTHALCFHDHLLRVDASGQWWFEALWTPDRAAALGHRFTTLATRLACLPGIGDGAIRDLRPTDPGLARHRAAIERCRELIAAGDLFQANVCTRFEAELEGNVAGLALRAFSALQPAYGAYLRGPWGAVISASPELYLRRFGRTVVTQPIKGTAPCSDTPGRAEAEREQLARSGKDRAENIMIVDLMRNDLGRVCAYGSITTPRLAEPQRTTGVWSLVSEIRGTLRDDVGDGALLRASFPPGSVTGAPKIQAMATIGALEHDAREIYTGAVGYASPVFGLELNVAIRTAEIRASRVSIGVGGGITFDSDADGEVAECWTKIGPLLRHLATA